MTRTAPGAAQRGIALIETLIGVALGLLTVLVLVQSFAAVERFSQANAGQADAQQRGAVALWRVQRELRMAGATLGHAPGVWGCTLNAWRGGTRLLPRTVGWPDPFAALPTTLRLTPIAVDDDAGPGGTDQIVFASGRGAAGVTPAAATIASATSVTAGSTNGFRAGDLLLIAALSTIGDCQVGQVDSSYHVTPGVAAPFDVPTGPAGAPYNGPNGFADLPQPGEYGLINLGTTPSIQIIGVNSVGQLVLLDALQRMTGGEPVVLAENVRQFQVLYGLDDGVGVGLPNDNIIDRWVAPTGAWSFATLHASAANALQIKAIRLAIVVRTDVAQGRLGPSEMRLFEDLPPAVQVPIPFSTSERAHQFQVYDTVIALRNLSTALCSEERRRAGVPAPSVCE